MEIIATNRDLMDGGSLLNVMDERPAAILPKHAVGAEHSPPEGAPQVPPASATAGESGSPTR